MFFFYLHSKTIIVSDKRLPHEQVQSTKSYDLIDIIIQQLHRTYPSYSVDRQYHIKKQFGWKYLTDEQREENRKKISRSLSGLLKTDEHKRKISESRKGRSNFKGKRHRDDSKRIIMHGRGDRDPIQGRRWCFNPLTGQEKRQYELPLGYRWGRNPEWKDYLKSASF